MSAALEIRNRVRFAAAQEAWDNALPPEYDDDDRWLQIEEARLALVRAVDHLKQGSVALCDQAMAEAAGYLL